MIPLLGGTADAVSDEDTAMAHLISLLVVGGLLLLFTLWTAYTARRRKGGGCWHKWGPTALIASATMLINADSTHNVLEDHNLCTMVGSQSWEETVPSWSGLVCTYESDPWILCSVRC